MEYWIFLKTPLKLEKYYAIFIPALPRGTYSLFTKVTVHWGKGNT